MLFNTRQFSYDGKTRTFVAEASDLGSAYHPYMLIIRLESERTGNQRYFFFKEAVRDQDGDVVMWRWASLSGLNMEILND